MTTTDELTRLADELERVMRTMQLASATLQQGHVAIAVPTMLAPVIEACAEASRLAALVPPATRVVATPRDVNTTAWLDANGVQSTLTVQDILDQKQE